MDPEQVVRGDDGVMRCDECGFAYNLSPQEVVDRTRAGVETVAAAVIETPEDLHAVRPDPSTWSINGYVLHLSQAADVILNRVTLIVHEDRPPLPYHEQDEALEEAQGNDIPADVGLWGLRPVVSKLLSFLEALPREAWQRTGVHARAGEVTLSDIAHDLPHELEHHAMDVRRVGIQVTR
jgi:DinB superfamily